MYALYTYAYTLKIIIFKLIKVTKKLEKIQIFY